MLCHQLWEHFCRFDPLKAASYLLAHLGTRPTECRSNELCLSSFFKTLMHFICCQNKIEMSSDYELVWEDKILKVLLFFSQKMLWPTKCRYPGPQNAGETKCKFSTSTCRSEVQVGSSCIQDCILVESIPSFTNLNSTPRKVGWSEVYRPLFQLVA